MPSSRPRQDKRGRPPIPFHRQPIPRFSLFEISEDATEILGDQCGVDPGPWAQTGHLRCNGTPFTIGICEAGDLYVRNDETGDAVHLPHVTPDNERRAIAQAIADTIGALH